MSINANEIDVTPELLARHDRPGPRYTSYPTAPEWSEAFTQTGYREALARAASSTGEPLSVYVHLPFCHERCLFCGCNVVISKRQDVSENYLEYLYREIAMGAEALGGARPVKQIHWGGGTPTFLTVVQLETLYGVIARHFDIAPGAEIAIEVDPCVTTRPQLECLRARGFNRISLGVQDLDPKVQAAVRRNQTVEETQRLVAWSRELAFGGVNMDLIYGLPEQREDTWRNTIDKVIEMRPDRLAVYSYAHIPSRIKHQRRLEGLPRPEGAEKYGLFAIARRMFLEAGYRAIGFDHFALPSDELAIAMDAGRLHRNFMGYTVTPGCDQVGFGVSAIGEVGGAYAQNEKRPVMYYKALDEGRFPTLLGIHLTEDDEIRRWVIRQLMCNFHLGFAALREGWGVTYDQYFAEEEAALAPYYEEGFLTREDDGLRIQPLGRVFIRNVCMVFDAYLKKPGGYTAFSRTV